MASFHANRIVVDDDEMNTKFILSVHHSFKFEHYMSNARVAENSFAYDIAKRIFRALLEQSLCLNSDYEAYYFSEYDSFESYLDKKMFFEEEIIKDVLSLSNYNHYYIESRNSPDQLLIDGLFDEREISNPLSLFRYEN
ncbi:hypothetical protein [uncultured Pseudodesulfovibrio sp.]|uniref:hypothetical protein n=1 Tax=uncultured Pseudodesulfovibrio sp. TaxID=2035858 RepID=UPI0029C67998|nr:hypothetical protein [uncultured Pseudodesulfovibrio sp.]